MFFRYNRIRIEGNNNLIIQDADGNTIVKALDEFVKKFTIEKDERIHNLEELILTKKEDEKVNLKKIYALTNELNGLLVQRNSLEKQVIKMVHDFSSKDLSLLNERYQQAIALFLDAKLDEALLILNDDVLNKETKKIILLSDDLIKGKTDLAEMFLLKAEIFQLKFDYLEAEKCYLKMLEIAPWSNYYRRAGLFFQMILKIDKAEHFFRDGLRCATSDVNKALLHNNLGIIMHRSFIFDEAELHYRSALAIYIKLTEKEVGFFRLQIVMYNQLATLFLDSNEYKKSEEICFSALSIFKSTSKKKRPYLFPPIAATYGCLANFCAATSNYSDAKKYFQKSIDLRKQLVAEDPTKEQSSLAGVITNLGNMQARLKEFDQAERSFKEALVIYRQLEALNPIKYRREIAVLLGSIGNVLVESKQFDSAEKKFDEALEIQKLLAQANQLIYRKNLAVTYFNLANLYQAKNELLQASSFLKKSLGILQPLIKSSPSANRAFYAKVLRSIAIVSDRKREWGIAEQHYKKSLKIYEVLVQQYGDTHSEQLFNVTVDMASLLTKKHAFKQAKKFLTLAVTYAEKQQTEGTNLALERLARVYFNSAELNVNIGRDLSEGLFQKSLSIYQRLAIDQPEIYGEKVSMVLIGIGDLRLKVKDYSGAIEANNEALTIRKRLFLENKTAFSKSYAVVLNNLGNVFLAQKNIIDARKYLTQSLWVFSRVCDAERSYNLWDLSELYCDIAELRMLEGKFLKAQRKFEKAVEIQRKFVELYPEYGIPTMVKTLMKQSVLLNNNLGIDIQ